MGIKNPELDADIESFKKGAKNACEKLLWPVIL
jgi:hypothetical protein